MRIEKWLKTGAVAVALVIAPVSMAAMQETPAGGVTPASCTSCLPSQASHWLNDMRWDARQVSYHASVLKNLAVSPDVYWKADALELRSIRSEVNDMGRKLGRLEAIRGAVLPWQRQVIGQAAPLVRYMADNTTDAINYMNAHQGGLWVASFRSNVRNLDTEASSLVKTIGRDEHSAYEHANLGMLDLYGK